MLFVVVNGIPSVGVQVMVGSGQIGTQPTAAVAALPSSQVLSEGSSGTSGNSTSGPTSNRQSAAAPLRRAGWGLVLGAMSAGVVAGAGAVLL